MKTRKTQTLALVIYVLALGAMACGEKSDPCSTSRSPRTQGENKTPPKPADTSEKTQAQPAEPKPAPAITQKTAQVKLGKPAAEKPAGNPPTMGHSVCGYASLYH